MEPRFCETGPEGKRVRIRKGKANEYCEACRAPHYQQHVRALRPVRQRVR